jgi:AraC family transcriptional regulator, alkane utilization regulator
LSNPPLAFEETSAIDLLSEVLQTLHLQSKLHWRMEMRAPWGLRILTSPDLPFHLITKGTCWLRMGGDSLPIPLSSGDLILIPQGLLHDLGDRPTSPATQEIFMSYLGHEGEVLLPQDREEAQTRILCGTIHFEAGDGPPLVALLPPLIHIKGEQGQADGQLATIIQLLVQEANFHVPGSELMRGRLTDLLFVQALRVWLESQSEYQGWLGALRDPEIAAAVMLLQRKPETHWTVEQLAAEVGLSRSAFATRFTTRVGESPFQYLKRQRLLNAARLLRTTELPMSHIAARVGYETEAALSKAFTQALGVNPRAYRSQRGVK